MKQTIKQAATAQGQTLIEFTISSTVREARKVIQQQQQQVTQLSARDRDVFVAALADAQPNDALKSEARRYKKRIV